MKRLLLVLALAGAALAQCGQPVTKGPLTAYCMEIDVSLLRSLGVPVDPTLPPLLFQVYVMTADPTTEAFSVTIHFTQDGTPTSVTRILDRSRVASSPYSMIQFPLEVHGVSHFSIKEQEQVLMVSPEPFVARSWRIQRAPRASITTI